MRRILLIIPSLTLGGAERSAVKAANALCVAGHAISIVVLCGDDLRLENGLDKKIKTYALNARGTSSLLLWWRTRELIKSICPETVVGWSTYANFIAIVATAGFPEIKVVVSERNYLPRMLKQESCTWIRRMVLSCLVRRLYPFADMVVANSEQSVRFLRGYVGKGPTFFRLPNILDNRQLSSTVTPAPFLPEPPRKLLRVLAVGRLDHQKGFDMLFRALLELPETTGIAVMVVGSGPQFLQLRRLAARLRILTNNPFVYLLPADENIGPYYQWADIVVVPSRFEGFPNVLLEAMACGKATVACNCRTGPREMTMNGKYGLLVPVDDHKALATAVRHLSEDLRKLEWIGASARDHVTRTYCLDAVISCYEQIA